MARLSSFQLRCISLIAVVTMLFPLMFSLMSVRLSRDTRNAAPEKHIQRRSLLLHEQDTNGTRDSEEILNVAGDEIPLLRESYVAGFSDARPTICPNLGAGKDLLILVTSAPPNQEARMTVRNTWGKYAKSRNISIGFIIAATDNATLVDAMKKEQEVHKDLVLSKSLDTYNNLTLKTVAALEWTKDHCSKVGFLLKTDDDVFINVKRLIEFISAQDPAKKAIYGRLAKNWKPIRDKKSKYYVSESEYGPITFPHYTTGPAYVVPARLAQKLYDAALKTKYFKLEDVFLTGIVSTGSKVQRVGVVNFSNRKITYDICNVQRLISIHPVARDRFEELWDMVEGDAPVDCRPE